MKIKEMEVEELRDSWNRIKKEFMSSQGWYQKAKNYSQTFKDESKSHSLLTIWRERKGRPCHSDS